jgi:prophage regulatory protein
MTIERKLVTYHELKLLGISYTRQHLSRLERQNPPGFPKRVRLGSGRVAWLVIEIDAWLNRLVDDRNNTA